MGKKKLEIKARETREGKQVTFSKRRMGLEKKAQELSILCDIPLLLLLFSPGQRLSWISGSRGTPEEVLMSYADIPFEERNRRKTEVLEQLSRAFKKSDHEVNVEEFSRQTTATQSIKDLITHFQRIRMNILQKLRECENPKTIEHARQMEEILQIRLQQIQMHRPHLETNECLASYNQTFLENKSSSGSSQCLVPYDVTLGQQMYANDVPNSEVFDATCKDAWEANCMPPIYEHEVRGHGSSCLRGFGIPSSDYLLNIGNQQTCYQDGDVVKPESMIFERDANYENPLLSIGGDDHSVLGSSILTHHDFCSSNKMNDTRPCYFQPFCEYEDVQEDVKPFNNDIQPSWGKL